MTVAVALVLSAVLPGTGLVYLGRAWIGLAVGVVFAAGVNAIGVCGLLAPGAAADWVVWVAAAVAASGWLASVVSTGYVAARGVPSRSAAEREALLREGLTAYLRADLDAAARTFSAILRLCRSDVEAHLRLAMVHRARGERREAIAALRRCRYYDAEDAWRWEIERELNELTKT